MKPLRLHLVTYLCACALLSTPSRQQPTYTNPTDARSLVALANKWNLSLPGGGDPCSYLEQDVQQNVKQWFECDGQPYRIVGLYLVDRHLVGGIPRELFDLTELVSLNLSYNMLEGLIPVELGNLTKLQHLNLYHNLLEGPIPHQLENLTKLQNLNLGFNKLTGPFPAIFGRLRLLETLNLGMNNLNGPIDSSIGNLNQLKYLFIHSCGLSEEIPRELAKLTKLEILWVPDNLFTGKLPDFLGNLTRLTMLKIQGTLLEGPIPTSFAKLTKLKTLILDDLSLMGSSLSFVENLTDLSFLSLRNNHISGNLLHQLKNSSLNYLDLSFNKLSGSLPEFFKDSESLSFLYLGSNTLTGEASSAIITKRLQAIDLSFNNISGSIPFALSGLAMNFIGTSVNTSNAYSRKQMVMLDCIRLRSCNDEALNYHSSLAINCGGQDYKSFSGVEFYKDSVVLNEALFLMDSEHQWLVSTTEVEPSASVETTDAKITGTLEPEIYRTARVSTKSLRYFGLGLENGTYLVELHFAEIVMNDSWSLAGIGRRIFDVYIQQERVLENFNILKETKEPNTALIKTFQTNVTTSFLDIHFLWVGRGSCCIPRDRTYGPLVSAIRISKVESQVPQGSATTVLDDETKRRGRIAGVALLCAAALFVSSSIVYLWWIKDTIYHTRIHTESPKG